MDADRRSRVLEFSSSLVTSFNAFEATSEHEYRFGVIQFGGYTSTATVEYSFIDEQALSAVTYTIDNLAQMNGYTPTALAVETAMNLFASDSINSFNQHMFIITDGVPTRSSDPCLLMPTGLSTTVIAVDLAVDSTNIECLVNNPSTDIIEMASFSQSDVNAINAELTAVPLPAAAWLFGTGSIILAGLLRRKA